MELDDTAVEAQLFVRWQGEQTEVAGPHITDFRRRRWSHGREDHPTAGSATLATTLKTLHLAIVREDDRSARIAEAERCVTELCVAGDHILAGFPPTVR